MAHPTDISNVRIAKEGPMPGYTGHIPGVKSHVIGHSYSDASKRGAAITETLRHKELGRSIHLGTENRVANQKQDFHAELSRPGQKMDPQALLWRCSVREASKETRHASGKVDLSSLRQCIGTTDGPVRASVPMHMSLGDLPYKDNKLVLKKEWSTRGPEYHEVNRGEHHMKGYTGHTHAGQDGRMLQDSINIEKRFAIGSHHICHVHSYMTHSEDEIKLTHKHIGIDDWQHLFGKTYGQTTRELLYFPAKPSTSGKYINYAENRPLVINEFELRHPMRFQHNVLLKEGEGTLGPLPEGVGIPSTCKPQSSNDPSQFENAQKDYYDWT